MQSTKNIDDLIRNIYESRRYRKVFFYHLASIPFYLLAIFSLVFLILHIDYADFIYWGEFFVFPGIFFSYLAKLQAKYNQKYIQRVIKQIDSEKGNKIILKDLSSKIGSSPDILIEVLNDLQLNGKIKYEYSEENDQITIESLV